jgi:hypothetical protein
MEVSKKTTLTRRKDTASRKRPRKEKIKATRKSKNVLQPEVEQHYLNNPQPSSQDAIQMRLEYRKFTTTSYWEIMRRRRE